MQLVFNTVDPFSLKNDIIELIEEGELRTWEIEQPLREKYLKHIGQWSEKGVIKITPNTTHRTLTVIVIKRPNVNENLEDFEGYYLGRFCELIFKNFPNRFTSIENG